MKQQGYPTNAGSDPYAIQEPRQAPTNDPHGKTWTPEEQKRKQLNDLKIEKDNLEASFVGMPTTQVVVQLGEFDDEIKQLSQQLGVGDRTSTQNVASPMSAPETKPAPYTPDVEGGDIGEIALQGVHFGGSIINSGVPDTGGAGGGGGGGSWGDEEDADPVNVVNDDINNGKYEELKGIEIVRFKGETNRTYTESDKTTSDIAEIVINSLIGLLNPAGAGGMALGNIDAVKDRTVNHDKIGGVYSRSFKGRQRLYPDQSTPFLAYYQYVDITIEYSSSSMTYDDIVYIDVVNDGGPRMDKIAR